jgi:hypothetical protein
MTNKIRHKSSASTGLRPGTAELDLAELAVNTTDGRVFLKRRDGGDTIEEVSPNSLFAKQLDNEYPISIPTLDLNFAQTRRLDSRVSFDRVSTASYLDFYGRWIQAASNEPRFDHDLLSGASLGLRVENASTNLIGFSEKLYSPNWVTATSFVLGFPSWILAPDATFSASRITENRSNNTHRIQRDYTVATGTTYTISVFVRPAGCNSVRLVLGGTNRFPSTAICDFNLATGTATPGASVNSSEILPLRNGWFRISVSAVATGAGTSTAEVRLTRLGTSNYQGDGQSGVDLWGAQIEARTASNPNATSYIRTAATFTSRASAAWQTTATGNLVLLDSNIARAAHHVPSPEGVMRPVGLFLEPAATNLAVNSETFTDTGGNTGTWSTVAGAAPDPEIASVRKWIPVSGTPNRNASGRFIVAPSSNTIHTGSVFVKKAELRYVMLGWFQNLGTRYQVLFDLDTNSFVKENVGSSPLNTNYRIEKFANGWYRLSITMLVEANGGGATFNVGVTDDPNSSFAFDQQISYIGNGTSGTYFWGAQIETGTQATSYIRTGASTVTRAADVASSSQVTRTTDTLRINEIESSDWFNPETGTFLFEFFSRGFGIRPLASLSDATTANELRILTSGTNLVLSTTINNVAGVDVVQGGLVPQTRQKVAAAYATNDFAVTSEGRNPITASSGNLPVVNQLLIGADAAGNNVDTTISRLTFYPARLPNVQLSTTTA